MNEFYLKFFEIACRECCVSPEEIPNRDALIIQAINKLPEKDRDFIEMLKPLYLVKDPYGAFSMRNSRKTRNAFHLNSNKTKKYKQEISHKIIKNLKTIIIKIS